MTIPAFMDIRFPENISYGSSGGPGFSTTVFTSASGGEQRTGLWEQSRAKYNAAHGIKDKADMDEIIAFFMVVRGRLVGFRYKDWADYQLVAQQIGVGDGTLAAFQLIKTYNFGGFTHTRTIIKPVLNTISGVTVNAVPKTAGVDYTLNVNTGVLTFTSPPGAGHAVVVGACEYDVPCRFDTDDLPVVHEAWQIESLSNIPILEIRPKVV